MQSRDHNDGRGDTQDASEQSTREETRLASRAPEDGPTDGPNTSQHPSDEENGNGLHKGWCPRWRLTLSNRNAQTLRPPLTTTMTAMPSMNHGSDAGERHRATSSKRCRAAKRPKIVPVTTM